MSVATSSLPPSGGEGDRSAELSGGGAREAPAHGNQGIRDGGWIVEYLGGLNTDDPQSQAANIGIALFVPRCRASEIMNESIDFDDQLRGGTIEVGDVWPDGILPAEADSGGGTAQ